MPNTLDNIKDLVAKISYLESIIKYSPVMIYWKDKNSIYLGCNQNFINVVGYESCDDIIGKTDYDLPWHTQAEKFRIDDHDVINNDLPKLNIEDIIFNKNGEKRYVITNKVPLYNTKKEIIGVLGIATDITERKTIENELRASKATQAEFEMLNNIIKYSPDWIYWKDKNSIHLGSNEQFAKAAGLKSREEMVGKTDYDFPWHARADKYRLDDQDVISSGTPKLNIEDTVLISDRQEVVVISNKVPLRNLAGEIIGILGIATDITHQKEIERDLKSAKEAAEAADVAKTEFIANMSHDIRTPLSGVVGLGSIVEQEITDPNIKSKIHDMVKSADELLNMLNEILDVVSLSNVTVNDIHEDPFDLAHLVQTIVDLEQSSVDLKKIQLLQSIDTKIPLVLIGDHKKIHHIILNLVGNSIKFTKTGQVNINIKLSKAWDDKVELLFEVTDTGMGIPSESLDKIFELFYKVTPSYKGLDKGHGVGLHIVRTYTELLGGKISVESKINEGSKFYFSLTLKIADKNAKPQNIIHESLIQRSEEPPLFAPSSDESKPVPTPLFNAPEILIIEDNDVARLVSQALVSQAKCNATPAVDGETGLELAKTKHFDLILTDIGLPGISGIDFTQKYRQYEKESNKNPVPIIAVTGHAEGKIHDECIAAGINEIVIKPIRPEIISELCSKFSLFRKDDAQLKSRETASSINKAPNIDMLDLDLPDTEQLFETDNQMIFDIEGARKILGDNTALLMKMLKDTVNISIPEELSRLRAAHDTNNWQTIADIVHKLKGGFVSIGLNRAAIACKYLERYHKTGKTELLEKLYQQVLKTLELTSNSLKFFTK